MMKLETKISILGWVQVVYGTIGLLKLLWPLTIFLALGIGILMRKNWGRMGTIYLCFVTMCMLVLCGMGCLFIYGGIPHIVARGERLKDVPSNLMVKSFLFILMFAVSFAIAFLIRKWLMREDVKVKFITSQKASTNEPQN